MLYKIELPKPSDTLIAHVRRIVSERPTNTKSKEWHQTMQPANVNCAAGDFFTHPLINAIAKSEFQSYFNCEIYPTLGIIKNTETNLLASYPPHTDRVRAVGINFYIDLGGSNVETVFYDKHDDPNDKIGGNVCSYNDVKEISKYSFNAFEWYLLDTRQYHSVENIETNRIILSLSLMCDIKEFLTKCLATDRGIEPL